MSPREIGRAMIEGAALLAALVAIGLWGFA